MARSRLRPALAAGALSVVTVLTVGGTSAAGASPAGANRVPTLHVFDSGRYFDVSGRTTFGAGRVQITAIDKRGNGAQFQVASFAPGYSYKQYVADYAYVGKQLQSNKKAALRRYRAALRKVHYWGGAGASNGHQVRATLYLPRGRYTLWDDSGDNGPRHPHTLTVTGAAGAHGMPKSSATVTYRSGDRFGGSSVLPARGSVEVRNDDPTSPHLLFLVHVRTGTTHKQVADYLKSGAEGAPAFALKDQASTDAQNPGATQFLTYSLPRGEYVELCFFLDDDTGMPHAFMGMWRIVTLK